MKILLTSFEAYGDWDENSSWLTMMELLKDPPTDFELMTRRYPVDLELLRERLAKDLDHRIDAILHLGQSPGASGLHLESVALNVDGCSEDALDELPPLETSGPLAYRTRMPVGRWAQSLREQGLPALVSHHAGTYLCNALMYLSHFHYDRDPSAPFIGFVHLPLASEQVAGQSSPQPSLPTPAMAKGVRQILHDVVEWHTSLPSNGASSKRRNAKLKPIAQRA